MLEYEIMEKFTSEWASPLVVARKPSGDLRICVDYRQLNETARVALPNMTGTLERLVDAKFFITIDMVFGYHRIEVASDCFCFTIWTVSVFSLTVRSRGGIWSVPGIN